MKKLLPLCLLLSIWWQSSAQSIKLKDARGSAEATPLQQANISSRQTAAIKASSAGGFASSSSPSPKALSSKGYPAYWPDRVYVKLKEAQPQLQTFESKALRSKTPTTGRVNHTFQRYDARRVKELPRSAKLPSFKNTYEVVLSKPGQVDQLLRELNMMPEVEYAERVPYYVTFQSEVSTLNDPIYKNGFQYAMDKIQALQAFGIHKGATKTLLAIVDDAVLVTHPDLAANINLAKSYDLADMDNDPRPPSSGKNRAEEYRFSHGTHCAGIAGAVTNNNLGLASVSNNKVSIMAVKVTSDEVADTRVIEYGALGMIHAINQGARVISMSYGSTGYDKTTQDIINSATANGVVFVAAAGNDSKDEKQYPAAYDNVIAVASSDRNDLKSDFSNYGAWIDITAPGSDIASTVASASGANGSYVSYNGTSMATPMVAGVVALMLSENPNLTPQAITQILKSSADPIETATFYDGKVGAGRINAFKAIKAIQGITGEVAPAAIADLSITGTSAVTAELTWTAPTVAGAPAATIYDVRYSKMPITEANFEAATKAPEIIKPALGGVSQKMAVKGLEPDTKYYFAVVARAFYGTAAPLSNVVTTTTVAAPRISTSADAITLTINRDNSTTASSSIELSNTGTGELHYTLSTLQNSGPTTLSYANDRFRPDNSFGSRPQSPSSIITATRFVANTFGLNLTHIQNYINTSGAETNATIKYKIYKGGNTIAGATLLASESESVIVPSGGSMFTFKLKQVHQIQPGETFWVVFQLPANLYFAQGLDETGERPNTFFLSQDGGVSFSDMQPLAAFLNNAALKVRAIGGGWLSLAPASGKLATGTSGEATLTADVKNLPNGTYKAELVTESNDPAAPVLSRAVTVEITGGSPRMVAKSTALDFGYLYTGLYSTREIIIMNTGVQELTLTSATLNSGNFDATNFAFPDGIITVLPGATVNVPVTFAPSKKAVLNGSLTFRTNDSASPDVTIQLTAVSVNPPVATVSTDALTLGTCGPNTVIEKVLFQNTGEADLQYKLIPVTRLSPDHAYPTLKYDSEANPDWYAGSGSPENTTFTAVKFDVTTKGFLLTHIQNYYHTGDGVAPIGVYVLKGGETPDNAELLDFFTYVAPESDNDSYVTIPLEKAHRFEEGERFWVMMQYDNVIYPQAIDDKASELGHSFISLGGDNWRDINDIAGLATSSFKIRAIESPQWLSVTSGAVLLKEGETAESTVQADASMLSRGNFNGYIRMISNDPMQPEQRIEINFNTNRLMPKPVIEQSGNMLSSNIESGNQWYLNGIAILGATEQTFALTESGTYMVISSCASEPSDEYTATLLASDKELDQVKQLKVYPNPATGSFEVTFTVNRPEDVTVRFMSVTGQVMFEEELNNYSGDFKRRIDVASATSGLYILQLHQGGKATSRKVIITK